MRNIKRSLLSATLSLSAVVASVFAFAPSAHAEPAPAPIQVNPGGATNANALQYHATGATVVALPLPFPPRANYTVANYPTFPTTIAAAGSAAPLFAFTDAAPNLSALSSGDITNYTTNKLPTRGRVNQIPVFFGAITPVFNPAAVSGTSPRISTLDLCKLFDGRITAYSGLSAPSATNLSGLVNIIVRSDSSGTTTAFTAYLANQCGALVNSGALAPTPGFTTYYLTATNGVNLFPTSAPNPSTSFARAQGNDGVAALVNATAGGHGYVEAAFAAPTTTGGPIQASLQSLASATTFLTASVINVRNATTNVSFTPNSPANPCVLTVTGLNASVANAYPIVTQSYALTYQNYPTVDESNATKGLFSFILSNAVANPVAQNDVLAQGGGFLLLRKGPGNSNAIPAINRLRIVARGCINNTTNVPTGFTQPGGPGTAVNIIGINFTATSPVGFTTSFNGINPVFTPATSVTLNADGTLTAVAPTGTITGPIRVGTVQTPNDYTP
jgi:ABC-type phosphate transport system substrate-binding protein